MSSDVAREDLKARIKKMLAEHEGPDNCITMTALHSAVTGDVIIPWKRYDQTRITRSIVEELRSDGMPIANKAGKDGGYYIARDEKELTDTIAWFHSRAMSSLKQEAALKRTHPGELIKQYEIELKKELSNG